MGEVVVMDKMETLVGAARFDSCGFSGTTSSRILSHRNPERYIYKAALPEGG